MPQGVSLTWPSTLPVLHLAGDLVIAAACFAIAITIFCLVRRREGMRFPLAFLLLAGFMFWAGLTHLVETVGFWQPLDVLYGLFKMVTALISIAAGVVIWRVVPKVHQLPSPGALELVNRELAAEVARRQAVETELRAIQSGLEARIAARTREVEEARARAEAADRAKSEFLAQMSHDLRTPLNAVLGFSDLMRSGMFGPLGDPRYQEYAADIHSSGQLLLELIEDMLDLARIEAGRAVLKIEAVVLDDKLRDCMRAAEGEARAKEIAVELVSADADVVLRADRKALRRVLDNLLGNAVRYTPKGGRIELSYARSEGGVRITVADSGPGIPADEIPTVTQPFMRGRDAAKSTSGTGLGLAIVKSMVELHGGRIEIGRAALGGAEVSLWLPAELPAAPTAVLAAAATA